MPSASFHFHPSFAPFLTLAHRNGPFEVSFTGRPALKHLIEALGVPHTEVGAVRSAGQPVGLGYHLAGGEQIDVLPCEPAAPGGGEAPRFVLDNHLGKLASLLRILGLDALYRNDYQDDELARIAEQEGRVLLTRDRRLLMRKAIRQGHWMRSTDPQAQLLEVMQRYALAGWLRPFRRCPRCNAPLRAVEKAQVLERLEPLTKAYFDEFHICPGCGQIYWKGSHYERIRARFAGLMEEEEE